MADQQTSRSMRQMRAVKYSWVAREQLVSSFEFDIGISAIRSEQIETRNLSGLDEKCGLKREVQFDSAVYSVMKCLGVLIAAFERQEKAIDRH